MLLLVACHSRSPDDAPPDSAPVDSAVDSVPPDSGGDSAPDSGTSVTLTPSPRARVDALVCDAPGVADPTFTWTVDGAPFEGITLTTAHPGDTVFPGYTRAGQEWTCTVADASASSTVVDFDPTALDPLLVPVATVTDGVMRYSGTLSGPVTVRYGFDGWSEREAPAEAVMETTSDGDRVWVTTAALETDGTLPLTVPDGVRAVHMVFSDGRSIDDDGGLEYTWDVIFPSVGPFLTWNDDARPENGMVVNWATGQPGLGVVEYGPDEENTAFLAGTEEGTIHHVPLVGLPSDTPWTYRVHDALGRTSPWASFTTAAVGTDTYTFLAASDMQDGGRIAERWPEIAAEMEGYTDARYVIAPGDLACNDRPGFWWLFFDGARTLFDHVPIVPAPGNHDTPGKESNPDTSSYRMWFDLPLSSGDEGYTRTDFGRTRILSVNTEDAEGLAEGGTQWEWLEAETLDTWDGGERAVDWAFAHFHHPAYDVGARFAGEAEDWRPMTVLFDGNLDVVFEAHEHIYQRFLPLTYDAVLAPSGEYAVGAEDGVAYLVLPAAGNTMVNQGVVREDEPGAEQRGLLAWPEVASGDNAVDVDNGFLVGELTPTALTVSYVGMGVPAAPEPAEILDSFTITH